MLKAFGDLDGWYFPGLLYFSTAGEVTPFLTTSKIWAVLLTSKSLIVTPDLVFEFLGDVKTWFRLL